MTIDTKMIFRIGSKAPVRFDSIAFADIVINLFIFFFISFGLFSTFDVQRKGALPIELPKGGHSAKGNLTDPITILITRKGVVQVGRSVVPLLDLKRTLNHELSLRKEKLVIVRADRLLALEQLVPILDVIRTTKARSVSIETDLDPYSPPSGSK
jgi:biopolymer transport protein ExbD